MINLSNAKTIFTKSFGRGSLLLMKHSPEILMGAGIVGVIASTVMACKATLHVDVVMSLYKLNLDKIHKANETLPKEEYSEEDYKQDLAVTYVQRAVAVAKLYAPAVALGAVSIGCLLGSHHILSKRNVALMAAYKLIDEGYANYRKRVIEELGKEKDHEFRHGRVQQKALEEAEKGMKEAAVDENGKKVDLYNDYNLPSDYARFFDEESVQFRRDITLNQFFLRSQQNYANDLLKARGHVFLNEVYDMLGLPRSTAGQIVGWVYGSGGDDFVDFNINGSGCYDTDRPEKCLPPKYFLLDFNVDGVIYDQI